MILTTSKSQTHIYGPNQRGWEISCSLRSQKPTAVENRHSHQLIVVLVGTVAWIDWNQNCDFTDPGEEYNLGVAQNVANGVTSDSPISIMIPDDAVLGIIILIGYTFNRV